MRGLVVGLLLTIAVASCTSDDGGTPAAPSTSGVTSSAVGTSSTTQAVTTSEPRSTTLPPTLAAPSTTLVPPSDPTLGLDACRLLEPDEVAGVLRVPSFGAGVEGPAALDGAVACQWDSTAPAAPESVRVEVTAGAPDQLRALLGTRAASASLAVPDVGDEARFDPGTGTLDVLADQSLLSVQVLRAAGDPASTMAVAGELAALMLPRLTQ